jgi:hypothetical protein
MPLLGTQLKAFRDEFPKCAVKYPLTELTILLRTTALRLGGLEPVGPFQWICLLISREIAPPAVQHRQCQGRVINKNGGRNQTINCSSSSTNVPLLSHDRPARTRTLPDHPYLSRSAALLRRLERPRLEELKNTRAQAKQRKRTGCMKDTKSRLV